MTPHDETGQVHTLRLDGKLTLRYRRTGAGRPLVLLHTIRTQLDYFREIIPKLSEHFTVYAVDLPGHGHSSIDLEQRFDEPYFRRSVRAFIEALDLKDVLIAGESIGAVLALTVASEIPERVSAVVASNAYDYDTRYGDGVRRGNAIANIAIGSYAIPLFGAISAALENEMALGIVFGGGLVDKAKLPGGLLHEFDRSGRRRGYRTVERRTFAGWRSWGLARQKYQDVRTPVTLVYGARDWSRPGERERTKSALPGPRLITLEKAGHFSVLEQPDAWVQILIDANNEQVTRRQIAGRG
jgi:pimeloyl-ACP methyl ester carboxylesterase